MSQLSALQSGSQFDNAIQTRPISVLLVDDRPEFRQGLQTLLDFYNSSGPWTFRVVGHAASVEQALQLIREQSPTLVLLDLELDQGNGLQVLHHLSQLPTTTKALVPKTGLETALQGSHPGLHPNPATKVLVLSGHQEDEWVFRAMQAGARGYVFKNRLSVQLLEAIATILRGEVYLSPEVATCFFRSFHFYGGHSLASIPSVHLTEREREVLNCLVQGESNDGIAAQLNITVGTVKAYLTAIFEKLEVRSRTQAALKALRLGLI